MLTPEKKTIAEMIAEREAKLEECKIFSRFIEAMESVDVGHQCVIGLRNKETGVLKSFDESELSKSLVAAIKAAVDHWWSLEKYAAERKARALVNDTVYDSHSTDAALPADELPPAPVVDAAEATEDDPYPF